MHKQITFTSLAALAAASLSVACSRADADRTRPAPAPAKSAIARGEQLVAMSGCHDCHTPMAFDAKIGMPVPDRSRLLSGHPEGAPDPQAQPGKQDQAVVGPTFTSFKTGFGIVYARNLTPDLETGLGQWSEAEFIQTMRTGHVRGTGRVVLPPMPWMNLAAAPDADLAAMYAYLRSIPPIKNRVPEPKVSPQAVADIEAAYKAMASQPHGPR